MTYFGHRPEQEPYQPAFATRQGPVLQSPQKQDGSDRPYTEEDYAVRAPAASIQDEAFAPDEDEYAPRYRIPVVPAADDEDMPALDEEDDLFDDTDAYPLPDADPLAEELLTDEEREELRRGRWQLISSLMDFAGVIFGTAFIVLLVILLIGLINWLRADITQTFTLWQANL